MNNTAGVMNLCPEDGDSRSLRDIRFIASRQHGVVSQKILLFFVVHKHFGVYHWFRQTGRKITTF
jgi:hypothetical protein